MRAIDMHFNKRQRTYLLTYLLMLFFRYRAEKKTNVQELSQSLCCDNITSNIIVIQ